MSDRLFLALPVLLVTILGLSLAVAARATSVLSVSVGVAIVVVVGVVANQIGNRLLPLHPRAAVVAFTVWSLCPGILAAAMLALLIYLTATFDPDAAGAKGMDKEMMKTFVGAFTAFITAIFVKTIDGADEILIGEHVKKAFHAKFQSTKDKAPPDGAYPIMPGESPVEPWVFDPVVGGIQGWGWRARLHRARKVAEAMKIPTEIDRVKKCRSAARLTTRPTTGKAEGAVTTLPQKPGAQKSPGSRTTKVK